MLKSLYCKNRSVDLAMLAIFLAAGITAQAWAQSWNIRKTPPPVPAGQATVVGVSNDLGTLTLRYETSLIARQFKLTTCYADDASSIQYNGNTVSLSDVREGDTVLAESSVYEDGNVSCGLIKILARADITGNETVSTNKETP